MPEHLDRANLDGEDTLKESPALQLLSDFNISETRMFLDIGA